MMPDSTEKIDSFVMNVTSDTKTLKEVDKNLDNYFENQKVKVKSDNLDHINQLNKDIYDKIISFSNWVCTHMWILISK